ncbi:hypothetical protein [Nonomuraea salmonea]|uniref:hypothetical protein n=1 Tax=Nonomuraea salmonea TaxID=46181 RepID=UPI0031F0C3D8
MKEDEAPIALAGRTVSSEPCRVKVAAASSTVTPRTCRPVRSRLKLDRSWVAAARMVATPSRRLPLGV